MLASTIQFSKYGQEHQPHIHHTPEDPPTRETTHPEDEPTSSLVRAGPSHHTQPTRLSSDPEKPVQPPAREAGPIPQDPTARLETFLNQTPRSTPTKVDSTNETGIGPNLMVNVPQSEALLPRDSRSRNSK